MKYTNKLGLPDAIVEAVKNSGYSRGDSTYTATQLIEPARIGALKELHRDKLEEDVSSQIFSLIGQAEHTILERAAKALKKKKYIVEERFFVEIDGEKISAQVDLFDSRKGVLQDYKVTSVYSVKGSGKKEWEEQLNIQAYLLAKNGHKVNNLQIVAILRDWSKMEFQRESTRSATQKFTCNYPENQIVIVDIKQWNEPEQLTYILNKIKKHKEAKKILPLCSSEERWERSPKFALMKPGRKSALRLFDTEQAANLALTDAPEKCYIEKRPGESIRCENYCAVAQFCDQWKKIK